MITLGMIIFAMTPCVEFEGCKNRQGYGQRRYNGKTWLAHRLTWTENFGEIPEGMCVCHKCDNPPCINIEHLFLGTDQDNKDDCKAKGRRPSGEKHHGAKLTAFQAKVIRGARRMGCSLKYLAERYGITTVQVGCIASGKYWKRV